jgi:hypothetical protein
MVPWLPMRLPTGSAGEVSKSYATRPDGQRAHVVVVAVAVVPCVVAVAVAGVAGTLIPVVSARPRRACLVSVLFFFLASKLAIICLISENNCEEEHGRLVAEKLELTVDLILGRTAVAETLHGAAG